MEMISICCCECGIEFHVPKDWERERRRDHQKFCCPNGHGLSFKGESDIEKAQREAHQAQARANEEQHLRLVAERERDKAVEAKKRIEKRVSRGVCPCCNRTFQNLQRHMKSKHSAEMLLPGSEKRIEGRVQ